MCNHIRTEHVVSRKQRRCSYCNERIPIGAKTEASTCAADGHIYTLYACPLCDQHMTDNCMKCADRADCFLDITMIGECQVERNEVTK